MRGEGRMPRAGTRRSAPSTATEIGCSRTPRRNLDRDAAFANPGVEVKSIERPAVGDLNALLSRSVF